MSTVLPPTPCVRLCSCYGAATSNDGYERGQQWWLGTGQVGSSESECGEAERHSFTPALAGEQTGMLEQPQAYPAGRWLRS